MERKQIIDMNNANTVLHEIEDVFNKYELNQSERQLIIGIVADTLKIQTQKERSTSMARQTLNGLGLGGALDMMKRQKPEE